MSDMLTTNAITANNIFAIDMARKLFHKETNPFASLMSVFILLALMEIGAEGKTKEELRTVLQLDDVHGVDRESKEILFIGRYDGP